METAPPPHFNPEERPDLASIPIDPTPRPGDEDWVESYDIEDVPAVAMAGVEPELARWATDPYPNAHGVLGLGCNLAPIGEGFALSVAQDAKPGARFILDVPVKGLRLIRWGDRLLLVSDPPEEEDSVRATFATRSDEFAAGCILELRDELNDQIRRLGLSWPPANVALQAARQKEPQE